MNPNLDLNLNPNAIGIVCDDDVSNASTAFSEEAVSPDVLEPLQKAHSFRNIEDGSVNEEALDAISLGLRDSGKMMIDVDLSQDGIYLSLIQAT